MTRYCVGVALILCGFTTAVAGQGRFAERIAAAERLEQQGEYGAAESILLASITEADGDECSQGIVDHRLGSVYHSQGRYIEAEKHYLSAIATWKRTPDADDVIGVSSTLNLAALYLETGQYAKADRLQLSELASRLQASSPDSSELAKLLEALGTLALMRGRYGEAENCYRRSVAIWATLSPNSAQAMYALHGLGFLYHKMGRHKDALRCYEQAGSIARGVLGPDHPELVKLLANLGALHFAVNGVPQAELFYRQAISIAESVLGPEHPVLGQVLLDFSTVLKRAKRKAEASEIRKRADAIMKRTSRDNPGRHTVDFADLRPRHAAR